MRGFLALLFTLALIPCALGQQKATVHCINAKTVPLFDSTAEPKIAGWIKCGTEVSVIGLLPNGEFYLVDVETTTGQTMRGNLAKFWLTTTFLPSTTPPTASQSSTPAAFSSSPSNSQPPSAIWEKSQPPSVIGSTYLISYPVASQAIAYGKVNLVTQSKTEDIEGDVVDIEDGGNSLSVPVRSLREAYELAEYVARKSPRHLELIGDAWRVRKPFDCPEANQIGCRDFKELLDHDDADIVSAFYSRDGKNIPNYACFSDSSRRFFTMFYSTPRHYRKTGFFFQQIFIEAQSNGTNFHDVEWSRAHDDYGTIFTSSAKPGAKQPVRSPVGHITQADLEYQTKYTNKSGTETGYSLSIRWSTGRYAESISFKDEKGKPSNDDETGICVKLN